MDTSEALLRPLAAAHRLGITSELLFQYTKAGFAKASRLRALSTVERAGSTHFSSKELDTFDALLAGEWRPLGTDRPPIPKAVLDHLRAESLNQCARCGSGIGVDTAHIRPWAESRSHHHANLIRLCSQCHREHDDQHSLSTEELISLKTRLIDRTRANLMARMRPTKDLGHIPRPASNFAGRDRELLELVDALRSGRSAVVTGIGGSGKTELLVQALRQSQIGRPVFWIDVEQYRNTADIVAKLQAGLGSDGVACPESAVPARLDAVQACVVFDGIERATLADLDEFEDTVAALYAATSTTQVVATTQILLHKLPNDPQIKVGKLDHASSKQLLARVASVDKTEELERLLEFCDGHVLTLKLASALVEHYGGASTALRAVLEKGLAVVTLPGRKRQNRSSSLELCLRTAYDALPLEARQLLWAVAESPAGVFANYLEGGWLELADPLDALAALRRWHLVEFLEVRDGLSRVSVLSPIRAFAIELAAREDQDRYEAVLDQVVAAHGMMVAVLAVKHDDPSETPYVIARFGEELPNLLHVLELARKRLSNPEMVSTALAIVGSLMRYFFVLGLSEHGAQVMHSAAELALSAGRAKRACALTLQLVSLAQRAQSPGLVKAGLALADQLELLTQESGALADIAMARGIVARDLGQHASAERHARDALKGYRSVLQQLDAQPPSVTLDEGSDVVGRSDLHNDISGALGLLGSSLLSLGRYEEAAKAYRLSIKHQRGASIAVNRGQTLHQLGNCESHFGEFREAAANYAEAAKIFHFTGMEEYLSNALGELGYAMLDVNIEEWPRNIESSLLADGLEDLARHIKRDFDPGRPLDHSRCIGIIRKLFGSIALSTLVGQGRPLGAFCAMLGNEVIVVLGTQLSNGERDRDEAFPLSMIEIALRLGALASDADKMLEDHGDIPRALIGEMLRTVCNAHSWAQDTMRMVDWFAALLTHQWGYQGGNAARLREFIKNYDADVTDYLDLSRHADSR